MFDFRKFKEFQSSNFGFHTPKEIRNKVRDFKNISPDAKISAL
jgi:hypothetical protein